MNVIVVIEGRAAIPVRAIPLLTDWNFMFPDQLVKVLSGDEVSCSFIRETPLQAWRIEDAKVRLIPPRSWESWTKRQLDALEEELDASGASKEIDYQRWRNESLEVFPAGAFVWQDEFESFHRANWNR